MFPTATFEPVFSNDPFYDGYYGFDPFERKPPVLSIDNITEKTDIKKAIPRRHLGFLTRWHNSSNEDIPEEVLTMAEEPDKYMVKVRNANVSKNDLTVNYHKSENELEVSIWQSYEKIEGENKSYTSSSSSTSRVIFPTPVMYEQISAEVDPLGVTITVPKNLGKRADNRRKSE